jgi:hypothetical protein
LYFVLILYVVFTYTARTGDYLMVLCSFSVLTELL